MSQPHGIGAIIGLVVSILALVSALVGVGIRIGSLTTQIETLTTQAHDAEAEMRLLRSDLQSIERYLLDWADRARRDRTGEPNP